MDDASKRWSFPSRCEQMEKLPSVYNDFQFGADSEEMNSIHVLKVESNLVVQVINLFTPLNKSSSKLSQKTGN